MVSTKNLERYTPFVTKCHNVTAFKDFDLRGSVRWTEDAADAIVQLFGDIARFVAMERLADGAYSRGLARIVAVRRAWRGGGEGYPPCARPSSPPFRAPRRAPIVALRPSRAP